MFRSTFSKINDFIIASGGYKAVLPIFIAIIALAIALLVLQQNWIKNEWMEVKKEIAEAEKVKSKIVDNLYDTSKETKKITIKGKKTQKHQDSPVTFLQEIKQKDANINSMTKEGNMYYEYDQHEKAVAVYEKLTKQYSVFEGSDKVFNRLAKSYYSLEDYNGALEAYKNIYQDYLNSPYKLEAQLGMGKCFIKIGNYDEARRVLYFLVGLEAKYKDDVDLEKVIEAYYSIADSYIEQAMASSKNEAKSN